MARVKRLFISSLILAIAFVAQSRSITKAQTAETKPRATASVTGRVMINDKPAPGVTVVATTPNFPQMLVAQTISDADGKYRLGGLMPAQLNISAVAPTYVMPISPLQFTTGRVLNLSADEAVEGIDFKMTRGSVMTGRVVDSEGKPVIGERLTLIVVDEKGEPARNALQPRAPNPSVMNTDDRGIYRIYGLPAGRYKIGVGDNGGSASLRAGFYQRTYHPDTTDAAKAAIIELGEGSEAKNIDITIGPRSRTYSVSGKIVDADTGEPVVGINYAFGGLVQMQTQLMINGYLSPGSPTNSRGEFRLDGVAPGKYAVMPVRSNFGLDANQPKVYGDPVQFEVTDSDISDLEIKTHRGLVVSGIVVTDAITNKLALAGLSSLIVSGFTVPVPGSIQSPGGSITSPIAADGSFQLDGLRPGKLSLNIGAFTTNQMSGYSVSRITSGNQEVPNRQLDLTAGQNVSGVRIYLQFGTGVVKGEIKTIGGTLDPGTPIMVYLQTDNPPGRLGGAPVDSRGRFQLTGIPAGTYDVVLQVLTIGPNVARSVPKALKQTVTVTDDAEAQVSFTLDLSKKEGP